MVAPIRPIGVIGMSESAREGDRIGLPFDPAARLGPGPYPYQGAGTCSCQVWAGAYPRTPRARSIESSVSRPSMGRRRGTVG